MVLKTAGYFSVSLCLSVLGLSSFNNFIYATGSEITSHGRTLFSLYSIRNNVAYRMLGLTSRDEALRNCGLHMMNLYARDGTCSYGLDGFDQYIGYCVKI
jgi:hypothetical protein